MKRLDIYNTYVQKLLDAGKAYYAWETQEELEELRAQANNDKHPFRYRRREYTDAEIQEYKDE